MLGFCSITQQLESFNDSEMDFFCALHILKSQTNSFARMSGEYSGYSTRMVLLHGTET